MVSASRRKDPNLPKGRAHNPPQQIPPGYDGSYRVVTPAESYKGKTYAEWVCDWVNWFFTTNPDNENAGPVVFLKQYPRLKKRPQKAESDEELPETSENDPNVMIGDNRLEIFDDQAILFPAIMAYWSATEPGDTEEDLRRKVRSDIDNGDNPPRHGQVTINDIPVEIRNSDDSTQILALNEVQKELIKYRIETPLFPVLVPEDGYGYSYKDYVEYPMPSGIFQSVACGYFFLIRNFEKGKKYIIHSHARGRSTEKREYYAELLYQIEVHDSALRSTSPQSGKIPERITRRLKRKLNEEVKNVTNDEFKWIEKIVDNSRKNQRSRAIGRP